MKSYLLGKSLTVLESQIGGRWKLHKEKKYIQVHFLKRPHLDIMKNLCSSVLVSKGSLFIFLFYFEIYIPRSSASLCFYAILLPFACTVRMKASCFGNTWIQLQFVCDAKWNILAKGSLFSHINQNSKFGLNELGIQIYGDETAPQFAQACSFRCYHSNLTFD